MRSLKPIDVSILVVSYNTQAMTSAALSSIAAETRDTSFEVIVVDNASSDGSAEMLSQHPLQPQVIALRDNVGFAAANNIAARQARGRYILLLNPDTVVIERAIDRLFSFAERNRDARIWGGRTLYADGRLNPSSCWGRMTAWTTFCQATGLSAVFKTSNLFNGEAMGGWMRDSERRVDIVSGCFFLIERDLWFGLHGFDPLFFMYGEEADLCLRARAFSARPLITPDATIIHYGGASERVRADKMVRLLAAKQTLISRHWRPAIAPLGQALLAAWPLTRVVATRIIALLATTTQTTATADTWTAVWRRRSEWLHGYAAKPALESSSLARSGL